MKIVIISGFLGSGKTSFIKAMTKATGRQFVVVENEFGELGLDGELIKNQYNFDMGSSDDTNKESESSIKTDGKIDGKIGEMKVWELTEGCICCSLNLDFAHSIMTISNTLDPDYLLVEPSGVAMPGNIISQLSKITYDRIKLQAPITIVDYENYKTIRRDFSDYFKNQIDNAGTIVVSKSEKLSSSDFMDIKMDLGISNDDVFFAENHYENWTKDQWFEILDREMVVHKEGNEIKSYEYKNSHISEEQELENMSIQDIDLKNPIELAMVLDTLMCGLVGRIVRAKGYFSCHDHWIKFDLVEKNYIITGIEPMKDERVVVIGQDLDREKLRDLFRWKNK